MNRDAPLIIDVIGTPAPQGSKRHIGKGIMIESSKRVGPWRATIAAACWAEMKQSRRAFIGPVFLDLDFRMPRPKRPTYTAPAVKPDIDKLERAVLDGLTDGGAWIDDAQACAVHKRKRYVEPGEVPGVRITIRRLV